MISQNWTLPGDALSKILLVEDDVTFAPDLIKWLVHEGHVVDHVVTGTEALEWLSTYTYDCVILDLNLPDTDGIAICRLYRHSGGSAPLLFLTGQNQSEVKEIGLDSGADDYMVKPPDLRELSARVRALLRRAGGTASNVLRVGQLVLLPASRKVTRKGKEIELTALEYSVLEFFVRNKGIVFSPEELLDRVWHSDSSSSPHTVRVCITRLRGKVFDEESECSIKTIYGAGYIFE